MTTTGNHRGSNGISQHAQFTAHHTINNHDKDAVVTTSLMHPISNNNRPNSSNMPYTGSHQ